MTPELKPETPLAARKFIDEWLWSSEDRRTSGQPWGSQYIRDAAVMAAQFSAAQNAKLESALNAAREAIVKAPHARGGVCDNAGNLVKRDGFWVMDRCDCWKAEALAQIDKALSPQQSKTT